MSPASRPSIPRDLRQTLLGFHEGSRGRPRDPHSVTIYYLGVFFSRVNSRCSASRNSALAFSSSSIRAGPVLELAVHLLYGGKGHTVGVQGERCSGSSPRPKGRIEILCHGAHIAGFLNDPVCSSRCSRADPPPWPVRPDSPRLRSSPSGSGRWPHSPHRSSRWRTRRRRTRRPGWRAPANKGVKPMAPLTSRSMEAHGQAVSLRRIPPP